MLNSFASRVLWTRCEASPDAVQWSWRFLHARARLKTSDWTSGRQKQWREHVFARRAQIALDCVPRTKQNKIGSKPSRLVAPNVFPAVPTKHRMRSFTGPTSAENCSRQSWSAAARTTFTFEKKYTSQHAIYMSDVFWTVQTGQESLLWFLLSLVSLFLAFIGGQCL